MSIKDCKPYNLITLYEKIVGNDIPIDGSNLIILKKDNYQIQEDGKPNYLYFIKNQINNLYKIGISNCPKRRFSEIQNASGTQIMILKVIFCETDFSPSAKFIEDFLHNYFKEKRIIGEWFDFSKKELAAISQFFYHFCDNDGDLLYDIRRPLA